MIEEEKIFERNSAEEISLDRLQSILHRKYSFERVLNRYGRHAIVLHRPEDKLNGDPGNTGEVTKQTIQGAKVAAFDELEALVLAGKAVDAFTVFTSNVFKFKG